MSSQILKGPGYFWNSYLRFVHSVQLPRIGSGAPVNGTSGTGAGSAGPGSLYIDYVTGTWYNNTNTKASPTWTAGVAISGAASVTTLAASSTITGASSIKSTSATAGVGYGTGAGGAVTQATDKSTGVTLSKVCGAITLNNASLADAATVSFTATNTAVAATDTVIVNHASAGTAGAYVVSANAIGAGSFKVSVRNVSGGALGEAIVLNYSVIKAVAA